MNQRFRSAAYALRPHISDTYELLHAADAVADLIEQEVAAVTPPKPDAVPHAVLVRIARDNYEVMEALRQGKRINAIKALRELFRVAPGEQPIVGLKAAKEACEDESFAGEFNLYASDPWRNAQDEPPF